MKSDKTIYWICINGYRYIGMETYEDAQYMIYYFKACGCEDELTIEAEAMEDGKDEKSMG